MQPPVLVLCIFTIIFSGQAPLEAKKQMLQACNDTMWRLYQNDSFHIGHAQLIFKLGKGIESDMYEATLACEEIVVEGTGSFITRVTKSKKGTVQFGIAVPRTFFENSTEDIVNHTCTFELQRMTELLETGKVSLECEIRVKSVLSRIVPHCSNVKKNEMVKYTKSLKQRGTVHIYFKSSENNIVRIHRQCKNNILKDLIDMDEANEELHVLKGQGSNEKVYAVDFFPDCDSLNSSLRKLFVKKEDRDCQVSIFALCQEGVVLVNNFKVDLNEGAMYCHPHKSFLIRILEHFKLRFRVESSPVALLLVILFSTLILYMCLIPCCVTICIRKLSKVGSMRLERMNQKMKSWQSKGKSKKSDDPVASYQLEDMEYDDGEVLIACEPTRGEDKLNEASGMDSVDDIGGVDASKGHSNAFSDEDNTSRKEYCARYFDNEEPVPRISDAHSFEEVPLTDKRNDNNLIDFKENTEVDYFNQEDNGGIEYIKTNRVNDNAFKFDPQAYIEAITPNFDVTSVLDEESTSTSSDEEAYRASKRYSQQLRYERMKKSKDPKDSFSRSTTEKEESDKIVTGSVKEEVLEKKSSSTGSMKRRKSSKLNMKNDGERHSARNNSNEDIDGRNSLKIEVEEDHVATEEWEDVQTMSGDENFREGDLNTDTEEDPLAPREGDSNVLEPLLDHKTKRKSIRNTVFKLFGRNKSERSPESSSKSPDRSPENRKSPRSKTYHQGSRVTMASSQSTRRSIFGKVGSKATVKSSGMQKSLPEKQSQDATSKSRSTLQSSQRSDDKSQPSEQVDYRVSDSYKNVSLEDPNGAEYAEIEPHYKTRPVEFAHQSCTPLLEDDDKVTYATIRPHGKRSLDQVNLDQRNIQKQESSSNPHHYAKEHGQGSGISTRSKSLRICRDSNNSYHYVKDDGQQVKVEKSAHTSTRSKSLKIRRDPHHYAKDEIQVEESYQASGIPTQSKSLKFHQDLDNPLSTSSYPQLHVHGTTTPHQLASKKTPEKDTSPFHSRSRQRKTFS